MMRPRMKQSKTRLAALAAAAVVAMLASPTVFGQACPSTGCVLPGVTVPNGATVCPNTGTPVTGINVNTTVCNNQPIDPATWVFGPQNNLTPAQQQAQFWNPVQTRMMKGLPIIGKRVSTGDLASGYCSMATWNLENNHFTWVDLRHSGLDVSQIWPMWLPNACPALNFTTTAARGVLDSSVDEREAQHDGDGGAIVMIRPVNSVRDAQEIIFWSFYPPFGHRSAGSLQNVYSGTTLSPDATGAGDQGSVTAAGGYRNSFNNNLVMFAQIGTVAGAQAAAGIAALDGIDALYLDEENLAHLAASNAQYNQLASGVRAAARANNKYLCTVDRAVTPNVMTCLLSATNLSVADISTRTPLRRVGIDGTPFRRLSFADNASGANTRGE